MISSLCRQQTNSGAEIDATRIFLSRSSECELLRNIPDAHIIEHFLSPIGHLLG